MANCIECDPPVLDAFASKISEFDKVLVAVCPGLPSRYTAPVTKLLSCLNSILGLSDSTLLSASASTINSASPTLAVDLICKLPAGELVPIPTFPSPSSVITVFSDAFLAVINDNSLVPFPGTVALILAL